MSVELDTIAIYQGVAQDRAVRLALEIQSGSEEAQAELFALLASEAELADHRLIGTAWQDHLLEAILSDDNAFSRKAELTADHGDSLAAQVRTELTFLRQLYDLDIRSLMSSFPPLSGFRPLEQAHGHSPRERLKQRLHRSDDWAGCLDDLVRFYSTAGSGLFGRHRAFRWIGGDEKLRGVGSPDPIKLSDLVEYDWQRESVRRKTQKLLACLPANNMLLYGDRGTGKSSTVKAMLNEFPGSRLRLIEVAKEHLMDLPDILSMLRRRPEKFILFIDDLSFEEHETQYKALKAVLEGGLEARPENVVLYATSNRRNLIKERCSERAPDGDEVHPGDTLQEKLSLSDRFGLKLPFLSPDQEEFLRIVTALAARADIQMTEDLRKKALAWQHARSGRSARQFVDYWIGEIGLTAVE